MREVLPLEGQTVDPVTGDALGDRTPLRNGYGAGRLDYYLDNGSVLSVDGGAAEVQNEIFVTGIGRVQVPKAIKPYARAALAAERYNIFAYWNSRTSLDPQVSLQSGLPLEERSDIFHIEGQQNWKFMQDRGRVVYGASFRNTRVNTDGTLMDPLNDNRSDNLYSGYGQVEYKVTPQVRLVGAIRFDDGDLIDAQVSPKGAIVFSPTENHSFRFSVNRAFQTPNYSEFFLRVPVGAPSGSPAALETGIQNYYAAVRASLPAPALAGLTITDNVPWNFSAQTQALALGNANLDVETVTGWEFGYKGSLTDKAYITADFYTNSLKNFVTDLLPGVNSAYPSFSLTDGVNIPAELTALDQRIQLLDGAGQLPPGAAAQLRAPIPLLLGGYAQLAAGTTIQGANALATLPDGSRAIVLSYTNAGKVTERGVEVGVGYQFTPGVPGRRLVHRLRLHRQFVPGRRPARAQHAEQEGERLAHLRRAAGGGRQRLGAAGGRLRVGGGSVPGIRPVERVRERERGIPGQQLPPGPRHGDERLRREAVPAVRRLGDRPAGARRGHRDLLTASEGQGGRHGLVGPDVHRRRISLDVGVAPTSKGEATPR